MRGDDYDAWLTFLVWFGALSSYGLFVAWIALKFSFPQLAEIGVINGIATALLNWYRLRRYKND